MPLRAAWTSPSRRHRVRRRSQPVQVLPQAVRRPRKSINMANKPSILTTTVGSYPVPDWLSALPSDQARLDATRVIFDIQRQAGIDLPTDGELYRFDANHPDTHGLIDDSIAPVSGVRATAAR